MRETERSVCLQIHVVLSLLVFCPALTHLRVTLLMTSYHQIPKPVGSINTRRFLSQQTHWEKRHGSNSRFPFPLTNSEFISFHPSFQNIEHKHMKAAIISALWHDPKCHWRWTEPLMQTWRDTTVCRSMNSGHLQRIDLHPAAVADQRWMILFSLISQLRRDFLRHRHRRRTSQTHRWSSPHSVVDSNKVFLLR